MHKPPRAVIPEDLIRIISVLHPDAWGLMGIDKDHHLLLHRGHKLDMEELLALEHALRGAEYVLHLCQRNSQAENRGNVYPFEVSAGLYLMHSGTLRLKTRIPGKSDTWHLIHQRLRPLTLHWHDLFVETGFPLLQALLENSLGRENHVVLLDHPRRRIVVMNRERGIELAGLWLSNEDGIDSGRFTAGRAAALGQRYCRADIRLLCT